MLSVGNLDYKKLQKKDNKLKTFSNDKDLLEKILNLRLNLNLNPNLAPKLNYNISPIIFQTWNSKKIPINMFNAISKIRILNPELNYYLFDDNDCRNFIQRNFDKDVLFAYDNLIPGAYKADLWRYCILYQYGGIYIDIKFIPYDGFKLVNLLNKEHWVIDRDKKGIYNAFMVCKKNNQILSLAINQIVENVKNKYYGESPLSPTGPKLLIKYFTDEEKINIDMTHTTNGNNSDNKFINYNERPILCGYKNYFNERDSFSVTEHYYKMWHDRNIYK